jgi:hypothetical protein
METSLEEWIRGDPTFRQADALPDWPEGTNATSTKLWSPNDNLGDETYVATHHRQGPTQGAATERADITPPAALMLVDGGVHS